LPVNFINFSDGYFSSISITGKVMRIRLMLYIFLYCGFISCNSSKDREKQKDQLFTLMDKETTGFDFINELKDNAETNIFSYRSYYNGGGVAIGDINNDGWNDVFLTSNQGDNKLYINKGNWQFEDVTEKAGVKGTKYWSTGVSMADVNADGWLDIYVCNSGNVRGKGTENELFINQHDGTFKESAAEYGLADKGLTTHAVFFDYDLDGDLDCYVLNNSFRPSESFDIGKDIRHTKSTMGGDRLYRNDNMHFTDVTEEAGIYSSDIGFGLGVSVCDINQDGRPDIYVSNDFFEKDYLYINQGNGSFKENIDSLIGHMSLSSMGSDIADINNDGYFDIFTTEMLPEDDQRYKLITSFESYDNFKKREQEGYHRQYMQNCLQLNNGHGEFSEIAFYAGIPATDWSWGALMFDMDNDGWKDIFVSNGIFKDLTNQDYVDFLSAQYNLRSAAETNDIDYRDYIKKMTSSRIANYAFINNKDLTFSNKAAELGLGQPSFSNGAAYGDLDNDGDNDLVVNNVNMPLFVYKNNAEKTHHHYLRFQLQGDSLNKFGIGSTIKLYMGAKPLVFYNQPDHGFQSSVPPGTMSIGTGSFSTIDSIQVIWPDGYFSSYSNIRTDSFYILKYSNGNRKYNFRRDFQHCLLTDITKEIFDSIPRQQEDQFIDYNRERLMPQTLSRENPFMAAGDINNDGLTDFYFGNASGTTAKIYVQNNKGKFREYIPEDFKNRTGFENAGAVFGDFDGDGDEDLIIAYGGNEAQQGLASLNPQYFENDGKGNLSLNPAKHLPAPVNASVIRADDFDKDGDLDLFIGGRSVPGTYGSSPPSFFFENDGKGFFSDITAKVLGNDRRPGMITDAQWADIDKNGFDDLVITGNWMGILIYKNEKGIFEKDTSLEKYKGWWSSLKIADVDLDGYPDIIAGNLGLNSKFKASFTEPMKLYVKDFDNNGSKECIISIYKNDHRQYVFHQRRDLVEQMPIFKKQFLLYSDYAGKEFNEIFPASSLKDAEIHEINFLESAVFFNKENMSFSCMPFPYNAQLSSVNTITCDDIDKDGKNEILLTGNFLDFKPEVGTLDANHGQVYRLKGDSLYYISPGQCGLNIRGETRSSLIIRNKKGEQYFLFGRNNAEIAVYKRE
jgi:enediyne biosynthesis protein E4